MERQRKLRLLTTGLAAGLAVAIASSAFASTGGGGAGGQDTCEGRADQVVSRFDLIRTSLPIGQQKAIEERLDVARADCGSSSEVALMRLNEIDREMVAIHTGTTVGTLPEVVR